jgi:hypothetical protein
MKEALMDKVQEAQAALVAADKAHKEAFAGSFEAAFAAYAAGEPAPAMTAEQKKAYADLMAAQEAYYAAAAEAEAEKAAAQVKVQYPSAAVLAAKGWFKN